MNGGQMRLWRKVLMRLVRQQQLQCIEIDPSTVQIPVSETEQAEVPKALVERFGDMDIIILENGLLRPGQKIRDWLHRKLSDNVADEPLQIDMDTAVTPPLPAHAALPDGVPPNFYAPHQLAAGEKYAALVERSLLRQRTTMSYEQRSAEGRKGKNRAADLPDMAIDARRQLNCLHAQLPKDCAGVLFDVCAYRKGLQQIETERGWPRRSAKLVLRIGFEELARHFGLNRQASGLTRGVQKGWMDEGARPMEFG